MKLIVYLTFICLFITGCKSVTTDTYKVHYANTPIKLDGKLDEPEWNKANSLKFKPLLGGLYTELGFVKILWDSKYVYVGGIFNDSDIVQESDKNWKHHYRSGDVMEVFLKPKNKRYYWEIYATPNSRKTSFFYLSKGRLGLSSGFRHKTPGIIVASSCDGTFNNPDDHDKRWTTEVAIPRNELEKNREKIIPGKVWSFLIGRYNYSAHLDSIELTTSGIPSKEGFHDFNSWNYLKFIKSK